MKIDIKQISGEKLEFEEEEIQPVDMDLLELGEGHVTFLRPISTKATVIMVSCAALVNLQLETSLYLHCSRCLAEFEFPYSKKFQLVYPIEKDSLFIDVNPDIRQEIILDYPIKPLCSQGCKGLCAACGCNLNINECICK